MNLVKHLQEALDTLVSVREQDSDGLSSLTTEQITALAKLEGKLEYLVEALKENK